ncbi:MAG: hypothetical protein LBG96_11615 [Tannerella sp.]|jgi:hypothetical protein|nr:hypothetical protein [Tannerella sp.]
MKRLIDLVKLDRLIRRQATGSPSKPAERLGTSRSSFREVAKECDAVPVSTFIGELHRRIDEHFDKNA